MKKLKRLCQVEQFRFSSHATSEELVEYATQTKPNKIFINHGDEQAVFNLYNDIHNINPSSNIVIAQNQFDYSLFDS